MAEGLEERVGLLDLAFIARPLWVGRVDFDLDVEGGEVDVEGGGQLVGEGAGEVAAGFGDGDGGAQRVNLLVDAVDGGGALLLQRGDGEGGVLESLTEARLQEELGGLGGDEGGQAVGVVRGHGEVSLDSGQWSVVGGQ